MFKTIIFLLFFYNISFANIIVFNEDTAVEAQSINNNFNYIKQLFSEKNKVLNFNSFTSGQLITQEGLDQNLELVRALGISVVDLDSISSDKFNQAFYQMHTGALSYDDIPLILSSTFSLLEDSSLNSSIDFLNSVGTEHFQIISNVNHGILNFNLNTGSFSYIPNLNYYGTDSFSIKLSDGINETSVSSITITILPVNDPPTISTINNQIFNEDTSSEIISFTINDVDNSLSCLDVLPSSSNQSLIPVSNITITGTYPFCFFELTPLLNQYGTSSIQLGISDLEYSDSSNFDVFVNSINDFPIATDISAVSDEDVIKVVELAYSDSDGQTAISCSVSNLVNITAINSCSCSAGICSISIKGLSNYNGFASFTYSVFTGSDTSNIANASLNILPINDIPTIASNDFSIDSGNSISSQLIASDIETSNLTFIKVSDTSKGTLILNSNGSFSYNSVPDSDGTDSFQFKVNDGIEDSEVSTVIISINNGPCTGALGNLEVTSGTVDMAANQVYQYNNIIVDAGATLRITGTTNSWTEFCVKGNLTVNGTILARAGYDGQATSSAGTVNKTSAIELGSLSYSIAQAAGGAGGQGGNTSCPGGAQSDGIGGGGGGGGTFANGARPGSLGVANSLGNGQSTSSPSGGLGGGGNGGAGGGGTTGGGGGGGYKGHHGKGLSFYVKGSLSGSGVINVSGRDGYIGGNSRNNGGGGGGGAGAGGSGGKVVIKYKTLINQPVINVQGGIGGSASVGGSTTNPSFARPGAAGSNGAVGSFIVSPL